MRRFAPLLPFLVAAIPAQVPPTAPVPAPPELLRVAIAGPALWRTRLLPTDLGTMLASTPAERRWRGHVEALDARLRALRGDDAAFARERAQLLDYAGTIHVVAWLEQAEDALHLPRWSAALVAEPDGRTDFTAMVAACEQWSARIGVELTNSWRDMQPTAVRCHEGRLLLVIAQPDDLAAASRRAERFAGVPLAPREVARLAVEVPSMLGLLRDRASERGFVREVLGEAARTATLTIGSEGPRTATTFAMEYGTGLRGTLGALWPARRGVPALDWLDAHGASGFCSWQVDGAALWPAWARVWAAITDDEPAAAQRRMLELLGADPVKLLLPHLHEVAAMRWGLNADGAQVGGESDGACLVLASRDEPALLAAITAFGPRLCPPLVVGEDGVHRTSLRGFDLAIAHGVVVLSSGEGGMAQAGQVLELAAARPRGALTMRDDGIGVSGTGRLDVVTQVVGRVYGALHWQLFALFGARLSLADLPSTADVIAATADWQPLLQQHRLASASLALRSDTRTELRVLW